MCLSMNPSSRDFLHRIIAHRLRIQFALQHDSHSILLSDYIDALVPAYL
jgi:hypothetical protein